MHARDHDSGRLVVVQECGTANDHRRNLEEIQVLPGVLTADLETITLSENSCFECHDAAVAADMGAVAVPASHRVDLRRSADVTGDEMMGSRWVCTSCHVARTGSSDLVANSSSP